MPAGKCPLCGEGVVTSDSVFGVCDGCLKTSKKLIEEHKVENKTLEEYG